MMIIHIAPCRTEMYKIPVRSGTKSGTKFYNEGLAASDAQSEQEDSGTAVIHAPSVAQVVVV